MLPLGQAQLDVQESKKNLKLLRPVLFLEVQLWHPSSLPYRWKMKLKSKRLLLEEFAKEAEEDYLQAFEDYESAKTKAIAFRQTARVACSWRIGLIAGELYSQPSHSQVLQKYNRALPN